MLGSRLLAVFLLLGNLAFAGSSLRFNSPLYSFVIEQPDGWLVDARTVSQVANFAVHPAETSWRTAPAVIFGRFVPRRDGEAVQDFVKADSERFKEGCPGAQITDLDWQNDVPGSFIFKSFKCADQRKEIVAVTELPSYFGVFILFGQDFPAVDRAVVPFQSLLAGFHWIETKRQYWHPEAEEQPDEAPRHPNS